ncbi:MAG: ATP-binding protein [Candidatus Omnitrophica bacterium]|nr:ATP-binding protein [Candidatus Omnitrophota bacterium]
MNKEEIIETLLLWNFWEKDIPTGIPRQVYLEQINRFLAADEIIALTGVRRCGKSTILLQVLSGLLKAKTPRKNTLYVNFEDPKFYNHLSVDFLDRIWQAYAEYLKPGGKVYVVLDEVQKIRGWEHWVRARYDRKENIKIFVTGSNADLLSSEFATVLTGRHLELPVAPLSFKEFLEFKGVISGATGSLGYVKNKEKLTSLTQEYLMTGGFPRAVLTDDELLRKELLSQYFSDILTKDIAERHKIKDVAKLRNLALFYSSNFTRSYSFNKVKKVADFALSLDSIHRFSHYMEAAFLVSFLQRFSYSLKNQMQTPRKVYLVDNGMRNSVAFKFSQDKGKLLENAVFWQLKAGGMEIFYYSEKREVDFVCKDGLKIKELYNVCYNIDDKETLLRETESLAEGMRYFKLKEAKIIVAEGRKEQIKEQGYTISIVPFYEWSLSWR